MQSFKSFILNEDYSRVPVSREDAVPFIFKNCQQWFTEIYGKPFKNEMEMVKTLSKNRFSLYRGLRIKDHSLIETASDDRPPRDTPLPIHNAVVAAMKKLGFATHRANCLFCTNKHSQAKLYSVDIEPFLAFPIDGYEYIYSEKIKDLYDMVRLTGSILKMNDIFPNIELFRKYIKAEYGNNPIYFTDHPTEEVIDTIPYSQLEKVFYVNEKNLQKEYNFKKTEIKNHIFNPTKNIEFMFRPKLFLTQWRP